MASTTDDDLALVRRLRAGSPEAAGGLVDRHWNTCWRVARGILGGDGAAAEDVVQESFVVAFTRIATFDPRRGEFGAWLHRITVNRALTELRRTRRARPIEDAAGQAAGEAPDGDEGFLAAIADLHPDHRAVVVLRYGLGYAPPEIAAVLDVPVGTVNSRLGRALGALRLTMEHPRVG